MTTAMQNRAKQLKNAKRGGYVPTIAKDINKHKVQKIKRALEEARQIASELEDEAFEFDDQVSMQKAIGAITVIELIEQALNSAH
ncbi:hypothetical protein FY048_12180 [Acinetobacter sp. 1124_18A]|uniref:hypothetical protein n=1 Tax=Acinetobacter sp. 1124_18A TaxID=2605958 RepID=UPI00405831C9